MTNVYVGTLEGKHQSGVWEGEGKKQRQGNFLKHTAQFSGGRYGLRKKTED